jgi:membrane associated rhomboid family serine protease
MITQFVVTVAISMAVFGVGGFLLGWFAGKRAYEDRMPAIDADEVETFEDYD